MYRPNRWIPGAPVLLASMLLAGNAAASDEGVTVLTMEADMTCASLDQDVQVDEVRDEMPTPGANGPIAGPMGQVVNFNLAPNRQVIQDWSSTVPVNYIITKAFTSGRIGYRVFHFGDAGRTSYPMTDSNGILLSVSFCYGQQGDVEEPVELTQPGAEVIPECSDLAQDGGLAGSQIACPVDQTEERVLISLDPEADFFNVRFCSCNLNLGPDKQDQFIRCDPDLPARDAGEPATLDGGCPSGRPEGELPNVIYTSRDPHSKLCYTIGGKRRCYSH